MREGVRPVKGLNPLDVNATFGSSVRLRRRREGGGVKACQRIESIG